MKFELTDVDTEIVLMGRSNGGKSTIMREITGKDFDTGRRPGVTRKPNQYDWSAESFAVTDMPGYGYMEGVEDERNDEIRDGIVEYLERRREKILLAVHVVDAKSFVDVVDRWLERDELPYDMDIHGFLNELGIPTVVAVNKIDKIDVDDRDERLNQIADRLGYLSPWRQWRDVFATTDAKSRNVEDLMQLIRQRLKEEKRHDLLKFFT
ncbi:MAG: GTP-binding protein EngB [Halobacteria archaeon]